MSGDKTTSDASLKQEEDLSIKTVEEDVIITHAPAPSATKVAVRSSLLLFLFVIVFTAILSVVYKLTASHIRAAIETEKMRVLSTVLPAHMYDNKLLEDRFKLPPVALLGQKDSSFSYRAKQQDKTVAVVLEAIAPDGYSGSITMLVAVDQTAKLIAARVVSHRETPGLGDYIDIGRDKNKQSPWITQFNGLSLDTLTSRLWRVKKDGGHFDFYAGATVSPRAVIKAVHKVLRYVQANQVYLFQNNENQ